MGRVFLCFLNDEITTSSIDASKFSDSGGGTKLWDENVQRFRNQARESGGHNNKPEALLAHIRGLGNNQPYRSARGDDRRLHTSECGVSVAIPGGHAV